MCVHQSLSQWYHGMSIWLGSQAAAGISPAEPSLQAANATYRFIFRVSALCLNLNRHQNYGTGINLGPVLTYPPLVNLVTYFQFPGNFIRNRYALTQRVNPCCLMLNAFSVV